VECKEAGERISVLGSSAHYLEIEPGTVHTDVWEAGPKAWLRTDRRGRPTRRLQRGVAVVTPEDLAEIFALVGVKIDAAAPPLAALVRDGWDHSDTHWDADAGEWTRAPLPSASRPPAR
jgi:hypothetical protein